MLRDSELMSWFSNLHRNLKDLNGLENPMDRGAWWAAVHRVAKSRTRLSDFTFPFHFHALEKAMAPRSSALAWRLPGPGEPGGLPSVGSHRVGHDWSDLAAVAYISTFTELGNHHYDQFRTFSSVLPKKSHTLYLSLRSSLSRTPGHHYSTSYGSASSGYFV